MLRKQKLQFKCSTPVMSTQPAMEVGNYNIPQDAVHYRTNILMRYAAAAHPDGRPYDTHTGCTDPLV